MCEVRLLMRNMQLAVSLKQMTFQEQGERSLSMQHNRHQARQQHLIMTV